MIKTILVLSNKKIIQLNYGNFLIALPKANYKIEQLYLKAYTVIKKNELLSDVIFLHTNAGLLL